MSWKCVRSRCRRCRRSDGAARAPTSSTRASCCGRQAAARVVARRRADELDAAERCALPPLHLLDLRQRHAPALEVGADAERHEEARAARRQVLDGLHVEVVVVIVRDEHRVDLRQVGERDRRRMEALRPDRDRRHALGEDRVEQQAQPVDLDIDAGVADPEGAQAARGRRGGERRLVDRQHRQRRGRHAHFVARELANHVAEQGAEAGRRLGLQVDEAAVVVLRIRLRALESRAAHRCAELRLRQHAAAGRRDHRGEQGQREQGTRKPA